MAHNYQSYNGMTMYGVRGRLDNISSIVDTAGYAVAGRYGVGACGPCQQRVGTNFAYPANFIGPGELTMLGVAGFKGPAFRVYGSPSLGSKRGM